MCSVIVLRRYKCVPISVKGEASHYREEGFIQVCGGEMHVIADSLTPLRKSAYKLSCNCEHCVSYSFENVTKKVVVEPLMRAVNMVFNSLCQYGYSLQSSTVVQNLDGSSTTTWVWTKR